MKNEISRRDFIKSAFKVSGAVAISLPLINFLSSCKSKAAEATLLYQNNIQSACPDAKDLNNEQIKLRNNLAYVDQTPIATRSCANCKLYTRPNKDHCGGCKILPGPVHPNGWCKSWIHLM